MSQQSDTTQHIAIIGAGCAGLSLAAALSKTSKADISLHGPVDTRPDHIWGFWEMPYLKAAAQTARASWKNWQICTAAKTITHSSDTHPYYALSAETWLTTCREQLKGTPHHRDALSFDMELPEADIIADSRPKAPPKGAMLQHFLGIEIKTEQDVFDPNTAILMDFRTDQSRGIHFIYLLPFSTNTALVESTYFTTQTLSEHIYEADITSYMRDIFDVTYFTEIRREAGVIPMHISQTRKPEHSQHRFIGGAGNAIRPSSGYAFGFIQKQINTMLKSPTLDAKSPHSHLDIWMDRIFLEVLHKDPKLGPKLFTSMAKALNGTEFARFMSGDAGLFILLKTILAMPKTPFFLSALRVIFGKSYS